MATRTSKLTRHCQDAVEVDRRRAADAADAAVVGASCELAPLSYAAMRDARDAGTLDVLLATVPAALLRAQALRFLVERKAETGALWGWGDVDDVASRFARAAARGAEAAGAAAAAPAPAVIATLPASDPALVDDVLARRQREAQRELDRAHQSGDAAAARFARERHDAIARARRYLDRATRAGTTLLAQLPNGDWQIVGSRGTPYTLTIGEGLALVCSCDHGAKVRAALDAAARGEPAALPRGVCWHSELVSATEEASELEYDLAA